MMSEAANFPELAAFYQQEVILPWRALIRGVLQRGVDSGEFVIKDVDSAIFIVMAPLMFLVMWQHSMGPCPAAAQQIDPERFLDSQIDILLSGVLAPAHGLKQGQPTVKTHKAKTA